MTRPHPVTFNPGPSQVPEAVFDDLRDVARSGLLSESHRGERVKQVLRDAVANLRDAMRIPDSHTILFQPSATACMQAVLLNCVRRYPFHFVHGAFSDRFARTSAQLGLELACHTGEWSEPVDWAQVAIPDHTELIAVTHNETSTGLMWPTEELAALRVAHPRPLLAVDVTSSFGALEMDWTLADVWFGSVQKCLGLPAGLGFLIVGPLAMQRAESLGVERRVAAWQDFLEMSQRITTGQTVETPNVLAIALLARQAKRLDLGANATATREKATLIRAADLPWQPYVADPAWQSLTVHNLQVDDPAVWKQRAESAGYRLGSGYGKLKDTCIRIANFPAHTAGDVAGLLQALAP